VLAALLEREATGRGRHLDVGLLDVQASFLSYLASFALNAGDVARSLPNGSHPVLVPAQNFATADGHVSLFVGNDAMWSRAKEVLRVAELEDPRFNSVAGRLSHRNEVVSLVTPVLLGATTEHWVRTFEAVLVPCAPVNRLDQALEDPQIRARGMIETDEHSVYGTYRHVVGPLPTLRRQTRPAPRLGEHSADVLAESGMDRAQVERLIAAGTVSIPSRASGA
jgi:crotonobetainyl-CoA:carnitine CoA-transferase CaiB-like acyl-CoA transferase